MKQTFLLLLFTGFAQLIFSQRVSIYGVVQDASTGKPISGVTVTTTESEAATNEQGRFRVAFKQPSDSYIISFSKDGFQAFDLQTTLDGLTKTSSGYKTETIQLQPAAKAPETNIKDVVTDEDRIPTITLSDEDDGLGEQNVSGILSASLDPFIEAASFNLSTGGFEIRGYDNETPTLFNGVLVNNLETGSVFWSSWGGLNDVTRRRENTFDLTPFAYSFGGIGGAAALDTRASVQRKGSRVSYMFSNRAATGRLMATWNTGMNEKGWAFSFSGSRRWAEEGYVPGTFYDAWSYFASVDKKLNDNHTLNLTVLGAPTRRGTSSPSIQEANDLAGTNFYNPNWGWQNGEIRNARVVNTHQPFAILRHDWKLNDHSNLITAASYMTGKYGRTQLDWADATNPLPDYYRKLPTYNSIPRNGGEAGADIMRQAILKNPDLLQVQWDDIYEGNGRNKLQNPAALDTSNIILANQRSDLDRISINTMYENIASDHLILNGGFSFQQDKTHYFSVAEDLLGGDYFTNTDPFAIRDNIPGQSPKYNLEDPEDFVQQGDTYRWDYDITAQRFGPWLQARFSYAKFDFFMAGEASRTQAWRTGYFRNGRFPDSSLGDSKKQSFNNYSTKAGITYKFNGRNYLYANGAFLNRAPDFRNVFLSARTRDQVVPGLTNEEVLSGEIGYIFRTPDIRVRSTFYWTEFNNSLKINRFYFDDLNTFGANIFTGINKRHAGVELAVQYKITPSWNISGVAAIGEYIYTNRPKSIFVQDSDGDQQQVDIVYAKNFYVPNTPQTAYSGSLEYRSPKFWSASITLNYFDRNYIDFNPYRRTAEAVIGDTQGSEIYNRKVDQERLPSAYTVDVFANKSFKVNDDVFFNLTLGITNLLNATLRTGGYEQLRFDRADFDHGYNVFPPRYFYAFGTNFFIMGALNFR
ncbi:MAG: TonB-dependent receptor [Saprospiraceae bacterium]|nr:TonB-dependent receptor [Saprospiraceae bacterium]